MLFVRQTAEKQPRSARFGHGSYQSGVTTPPKNYEKTTLTALSLFRHERFSERRGSHNLSSKGLSGEFLAVFLLNRASSWLISGNLLSVIYRFPASSQRLEAGSWPRRFVLGTMPYNSKSRRKYESLIDYVFNWLQDDRAAHLNVAIGSFLLGSGDLPP